MYFYKTFINLYGKATVAIKMLKKRVNINVSDNDYSYYKMILRDISNMQESVGVEL